MQLSEKKSMDFLYNDEVIMHNHDAQLIRESEARGRNEGISIGRSNTLKEMIRRGIITPEQAAQF